MIKLNSTQYYSFLRTKRDGPCGVLIFDGDYDRAIIMPDGFTFNADSVRFFSELVR